MNARCWKQKTADAFWTTCTAIQSIIAAAQLPRLEVQREPRHEADAAMLRQHPLRAIRPHVLTAWRRQVMIPCHSTHLRIVVQRLREDVGVGE